MDSLQKLQSVGINVATMQKGDVYSPEKVVEAYYKLDPRLPERVAAFERGERDDPLKFAHQQVTNIISKLREELELPPLVFKMSKGALRVLRDEEAVDYLNAQANAGIKKHRNKTQQLFTHVDPGALNEASAKKLDAHRRRHAFIAASAQGARTQALRMQRKGLQLPEMN